ncbi:hypothetical protein A8C56_23265 [Niabella ginsenosidivorans]|uniref:Uncharacterized protein n=1 Tax=Niabella ginsenosidivorans TaxID=1176587 RepID=A0A1A9I845_9BACT|nr:hypothetical protein A8C56_23265 [Niabella ginsenosidivorans]
MKRSVYNFGQPAGVHRKRVSFTLLQHCYPFPSRSGQTRTAFLILAMVYELNVHNVPSTLSFIVLNCAGP